MAIKTMRKGSQFADIFDSPETIAQAQKDGYHLCDEAELAIRDAELKALEKKSDKPGNDNDELNITPHNDVVYISLAAMEKNKLLQFAGKRKLYDKAVDKALDQEALVKAFIERAQAKVVEAGLKTAEEATGITEEELFSLFDSIPIPAPEKK